MGRIGFARVAGYHESDMQALDTRPDLGRRTERITAATLSEKLASAQPPADNRTKKEWRERRIEGSLNIPLNRLPERIEEIPGDQMVVVHCASSYRSSIAASLLERHYRPGIERSAWMSPNRPKITEPQ